MAVDMGMLLDKAQAYIDIVNAVDPVIRAAAAEVIEGFQVLSNQDAADITHLLTGNPIADRARLETAAAAGVVNSKTDWANLPEAAFRIAKVGLDLAKIAAAFL